MKHHKMRRQRHVPLRAQLVLLIFAFLFCWIFMGCASAPVEPPQPRACVLPAALREVFRGGELVPLQTADGPALGMPNNYDLVSHTCVSTPIFGIDGRYVRTAVRCW